MLVGEVDIGLDGRQVSDLTDALESLIAHPGWRRLCDLARQEWTVRERKGRLDALKDTDDKRALDKLRQITAAQEAVEWVLALPSEELSKLKRQLPPTQDEMVMSRRGSL